MSRPASEVLQVACEAMDRDGEERARYLDAACAADADMRREVEALLGEASKSGGVLDRGPWTPGAFALGAGTRLGPYEIQERIGAGGMGEVYRARDTRLGRPIAIKVLQGVAALDPERRRRFEHEARAIAALNHPHICSLHDIGREGPIDFLVMEYIEGQTLADRLAERAGSPDAPLAAIEEVLDIGAQIAAALAAAHRVGILHRDLKPGNIMLVRSGGVLNVKLLDFGLAKLNAAAAANDLQGPSMAAGTLTTAPGAVMGTVPYMAPELLDGRPADARSDLFAFGCVLYEMIAGRRAFEGASEARVASAILSSEPPPVSTRRPGTPPALDRLVTACLAKDPDARRQSAQDVAEELRWIAKGTGSSFPVGRTPAASRRRRRLIAAAIFVVCAAAGLGWGLRQLGWPGATAPARIDVALPESTVFTGGVATGIAMAPDGTGLVYSATDQVGARLYWQALDGSRPRPIPGTEGAALPFFSPDGQQLGFTLHSTLVAIPFPDGQPGDGPITPLLQLAGGYREPCGATWDEDGTVLLSTRRSTGLWRVSSGDAAAHEVTRPDPARNEAVHTWPSVIPGHRAALFTILHSSTRQDRSAIAVLSLDTGKWKRLVEGGTYARYLPPGYLVYASNRALMAVRFDADTLTIAGSPVPVAGGVEMIRFGGEGMAWFDVSRSGSLVFVPAPDVPMRSAMVWVDRNGHTVPAIPEQRGYIGRLDLSPDGRKLALVVEEGHHYNLAVYHLDSGRWQPLPMAADDNCPVWSPDGDRLAFSSNRDGAFNVYVMKPDEPGGARRLTWSAGAECPRSWSRDGRWLAYTQGLTTWLVDPDGGRPPRQWPPEGGEVSGPSFSPDARWMAYSSRETGDWDVHVRPFPGPGPRRTVSGAEGGYGPLWGDEGRQILYLARSPHDNRVLVSDLPADASRPFAPSHLAFGLPFSPEWTRGPFDKVGALARDGRLITVRPDEAAAPDIHSLTLVSRWVNEIAAKVK